MTPERIAEIQRLADAATPGPWRVDAPDDGMVVAGQSKTIVAGCMGNSLAEVRANALLIASAPDVLAALAAERARADELQDAAHWLTNERERLQLELQDATQERDQLRAQRDAALAALVAPCAPDCDQTHTPNAPCSCYSERIERARAIFQAADQRGGEVGE